MHTTLCVTQGCRRLNAVRASREGRLLAPDLALNLKTVCAVGVEDYRGYTFSNNQGISLNSRSGIPHFAREPMNSSRSQHTYTASGALLKRDPPTPLRAHQQK